MKDGHPAPGKRKNKPQIDNVVSGEFLTYEQYKNPGAVPTPWTIASVRPKVEKKSVSDP